MSESTTAEKPTLFNVETKDIDPYWVDPKQPLRVPVDPLHFEAHKLQLLLERLDGQATRNPAQFNSANYINVLDKFTKLCEGINKGTPTNEVLDSSGVDQGGNSGTTQEVGKGNAPRVDTGVSTDNPLAG